MAWPPDGVPREYPVVRLEFSVTAGQRVAVGPYEGPPAGTGSEFAVDWGDGTPCEYFGSTESTSMQGQIRPEHVYLEPGRHVASFETSAFSLSPSSVRHGTFVGDSAVPASPEDMAGALALSDVVSFDIPEGKSLTLYPNAFRSCPLLSGTVGSRVDPSAARGRLAVMSGLFRGCSRVTGLAPGFLELLDGAARAAEAYGADPQSGYAGPGYSPLHSVFEGCRSLRSAPMSSLAADPDSTDGRAYRWGESCFDGCSALSELPFGPTFYGQVGLWRREFARCTSLADLGFLRSAMVLSFREGDRVSGESSDWTDRQAPSCFEGCTSLSDISALADVPWNGETVTFPSRTFYGCSALVSLGLSGRPSSNHVTGFGPECFRKTSLASLAGVPSGLRHVGESCFEGLDTLLSADLSGTSAFADRRAFAGCRHLRSAAVPGGIGEEAFAGCYVPPVTDERTGEVLVPADGLVSVALPDSTALHVPDGAFDGCALLPAPVAPSAPAGTGFQGAGARAYRGCASIASLMPLPAVSTFFSGVSFGESCFDGCVSLADAHVRLAGWKVRVLSRRVFAGCASAPRLPLSPAVEEVGEEAFAGCAAAEAPQDDEASRKDALIPLDPSAPASVSDEDVPPPPGSFLLLYPASCRLPPAWMWPVLAIYRSRGMFAAHSLAALAAPPRSLSAVSEGTASFCLPALGPAAFAGCGAHELSDLYRLSERVLACALPRTSPRLSSLVHAFGLPSGPATAAANPVSTTGFVVPSEYHAVSLPDMSDIDEAAPSAATYGWMVVRVAFHGDGSWQGTVDVLVWPRSVLGSVSSSADEVAENPYGSTPYLCTAPVLFGAKILACGGGLAPDALAAARYTASASLTMGSTKLPDDTPVSSVTVRVSAAPVSGYPTACGASSFSAEVCVAWDVGSGMRLLTRTTMTSPTADRFVYGTFNGTQLPVEIRSSVELLCSSPAPVLECSAVTDPSGGTQVTCDCAETVVRASMTELGSAGPLLYAPDSPAASGWVRALLGFYCSVVPVREPGCGPYFGTLSISPAAMAWGLPAFLRMIGANSSFQVPRRCFAGAAGPARLMPKYDRVGPYAFEGSSATSVASESRLTPSTGSFASAAIEDIPPLASATVPSKCFAGTPIRSLDGLSPRTISIMSDAFADCTSLSRILVGYAASAPVPGIPASASPLPGALLSAVGESGSLVSPTTAAFPSLSRFLPVETLGRRAFAGAGTDAAPLKLAVSGESNPYVLALGASVTRLEPDLLSPPPEQGGLSLIVANGDVASRPIVLVVQFSPVSGGAYTVGVLARQTYVVSKSPGSAPSWRNGPVDMSGARVLLLGDEVPGWGATGWGFGRADGDSGHRWLADLAGDRYYWGGNAAGGVGLHPASTPFAVCVPQTPDAVDWSTHGLVDPTAGQAPDVRGQPTGGSGTAFTSSYLESVFTPTATAGGFAFVVRYDMSYYSVALSVSGQGAAVTVDRVADDSVRPLVAGPGLTIGETYPVPVFPLLSGIADRCFENACVSPGLSWIPPAVTRLPAWCFAGARFFPVADLAGEVDGAPVHLRDVASVTVPGTVTSIGPNCFAGCHNLRKLTVSGAAWQAWRDEGHDPPYDPDDPPWGLDPQCSVVVSGSSGAVWGPTYEKVVPVPVPVSGSAEGTP